jgi:monoamine oxidase
LDGSFVAARLWHAVIAIAKYGKSHQTSGMTETDVVVIGGGAAGIGAARRLTDAGVPCVLIEARGRLGGRAWTSDFTGYPLDLGAGWLHSADRNPLTEVAIAQGKHIDRTPPPWTRICKQSGFPADEQRAFREAQQAFFARIDAIGRERPEAPASEALEPNGRWNGLISAVTTYIAGAEPDRVAMADFAEYEDSNVNWRVVEGYGAAIAAHAQGVRVEMNCPVQRIDRTGTRLRIVTAKGEVTAAQVIVTLPTSVLAEAEDFFSPALPEKAAAARSLPLGLADKLFITLQAAEEFEPDSRMWGTIDRAESATYHMRPFGRPMIEVYFGGRNAEALEADGLAAFFDFAVSDLTRLMGNDFRKRLAPIGMHCWAADPFARGSYSYAVPGKSRAREQLAATVEDRVFFAGEACSPEYFTTVQGAYLTGLRAADAVVAARSRTTIAQPVAAKP